MSIEVKLWNMAVELESPDRAVASFVQAYRSDTYADIVTKTLVLVREGGAWKILEARSEAPEG